MAWYHRILTRLSHPREGDWCPLCHAWQIKNMSYLRSHHIQLEDDIQTLPPMHMTWQGSFLACMHSRSLSLEKYEGVGCDTPVPNYQEQAVGAWSSSKSTYSRTSDYRYKTSFRLIFNESSIFCSIFERICSSTMQILNSMFFQNLESIPHLNSLNAWGGVWTMQFLSLW